MYRKAAVAAALLVLGACSEVRTPTGGSDPHSDSPLSSISDAASGSGRDGFYFLPPMVANPGPFTGTFDPTLSPVIRVCVLPACTTVIKSFNGSTGAERVTADLKGESYSATWNTRNNPQGLSLGPDVYRLEVWVGSVRVGFADLWFVQNNKQLSSVTAGYVGVVSGGTLNMKFRLETRTVGTVTVTPAEASITLPATQAFTAVVRDLHGNVVPGAEISWTSSNTAVATVSPLSGAGTTATGVTNGTVQVIAESGGAQGTASLEVIAESAPVANDDSYSIGAGATLTVPAGAGPPAGLMHNDVPGLPAVSALHSVTVGGTTITSFPATGLSFAGGDLSISADGSFTLTAPTAAAQHTFSYRLQNGIGFDDATVTVTVSPGAATQLEVTTQPSAAAQSGIAFAQQPVVQLRDAYGNAVATSGVTVTAAIATGGGTLGGITEATTDATGAASFTNLSITGTAGERTLSFSASGVAAATSAAISLGAGTAAQLAITTQPSSTAESGAAFTTQPVIQVQDGAGNAASQSGTVVTAALASGTGLLGGELTATTNASGQATFTDLRITGVAGEYTLSFSAAPLTPATSHTITLGAGAATRLAITVQPSNATAGAAITPAIQVTIQDGAGNTVGTATDDVTLAIANNAGGGTLSGTKTVPAVNGVASFSDLSIDLVGTGYTLEASAGALTPATSDGFDISAAAAARLAFAVQPTNAVAGVSIAPAVQVLVEDAFGNAVISTAEVTLAITAGTGAETATLGGTTSVAAVNGVATFSDLLITKAATGYTLDATAAALTGATSSAFDIAPAAAHSLAVAPATASIGAGGTQLFTATVKDQYDNVLPSPTVNWNSSNTLIATVSPATGTSTTATAAAPIEADTEVIISAQSGAAGGQATLTVLTIAPPIARDDEFTTTAGSELSGNLFADNGHGADDRGTPLAEIASFGGGSLAGDASATAAGGSVSLAGGTLTVNADGSFSLSGASTAATFTFHYRLTNAAGSDDATVTIVLQPVPVAVNDAYTAVGNTLLEVSAAAGLLANDTDPGNPGPVPGTDLFVKSGSVARVAAGSTTTGTGTFNVEPDGSFTYMPPVGETGVEVWEYLVEDDDGLAGPLPGQVTFTISDIVWYVNHTSAAGGNGTSAAPFNSIADYNAASTGTGGIVYFFRGTGANYAGNLTLVAGRRLVGEGVALVAGAVTLRPAGAAPNLTGVITLTSNNGLHGFAGARIQETSTVSFGTLTVSQVSLSSNNRAIALRNGTVSGSFISVTSTGGVNNIWLREVGGTFSLGTGELSGSTEAAFHIGDENTASSGSNPVITYSGNITNTAGRSVSISRMTGGSVTLSGNLHDTGEGIYLWVNAAGVVIEFSGASKVLNTGAFTAIRGFANSGTIMRFSNGGLQLETTTADAIWINQNSALPSQGLLSITGTGNTASVGSGRAVNMTFTSIAADGIRFDRIDSSSGGAVNLSNVGTLGALHIVGDGTPGSGGVLNAEGGTAISTVTAGAVVLHNVDFINGTALSGPGPFTVNDVRLTSSALNIAGPINGNFATVQGTREVGNSANGLYNFNQASGSFTVDGGNLIVDSGAGTGIHKFMQILGGSVNITWNGNVTRKSSSVNVSNHFIQVGSNTLANSHSGTVTFNGALVTGGPDGTGPSFGGIHLSWTAGNYHFNGLLKMRISEGRAFYLDKVGTGTLTFANVDVVKTGGGRAMEILGGDPVINFTGNIDNTGGSVIHMDGSGAKVTWNGDLIGRSGLGIQVSFMANAAGFFDYTGNADLTITTTGTTAAGVRINQVLGAVRLRGSLVINTSGTSTPAFTAINTTVTYLNKGMITVEGTQNVITTTTGSPLWVRGIAIGPAGLNFRSITAGTAESGILNSGISPPSGQEGIWLENTGMDPAVHGRLVVTGTGAPGSGGTLTQISHHSLVVLTNTRGADLHNVILDQIGGASTLTVNANSFGLFGMTNGSVTSNGTALRLTNGQVNVTGTHLTSHGSGVDMGGVALQDVSGTLIASGGSFTAGGGSSFRVATFKGNTSGTFDLSAVTMNAVGTGGLLFGSGASGIYKFGDISLGTLSPSSTVVGVDVSGAPGEFTFRSISQQNGLHGIRLQNTPGTFRFTVTGTGSTPGSGGHIQGTSGAAISQTSVGGLVSINNMTVNGSPYVAGMTLDSLLRLAVNEAPGGRLAAMAP